VNQLAVLAMRSMEYVRAAEAVGASDFRILFRHIMPNNFSHIIVWVTYQLPEVILLESFLSFLGVGIQPPMVSWGSMLNQILDFQSFGAAPWMMSPVLMIIITVLAVVLAFVGDPVSAVGFFGAYAVVLGVFLVIAGLSARWSTQLKEHTAS
jgi:ABC-type dipeptide/oligopeptide/nickel transport system permease subunit